MPLSCTRPCSRVLRAAALSALTSALAVLAGPSMAAAQSVTRGPYLQMPGPDRMLVVWHTDLALVDPQVDYGTTLGLGTVAIGSSSSDALGGFKHEVQLSGLAADSKHFYALGSAAGPLTVAATDYAFRTAPAYGTARPIRIWTYGDAGYWPGRLATEYQDTRQAYFDLVGGGDLDAAADATDFTLFLGDNAYLLGNDASYQAEFFGPPELQAWLQREPFFSAVGNHEGFVANTIAETGDYYDMFYHPTAGELGVNGVASGSESYYSFDYGNIHFLVLDSEDTIENIDTTGAAMLTWVENDLIATSADWIIAAWHRPPYSKGILHDSDTEVNEIDMREVIVPILDDYGVDLVLNAHAHTYERSALLDGHYGMSGTLELAHLKDGGDGDPSGEGAYRKASSGQGPHQGTVYVVAGSAADVRTIDPPAGHPVMVRSLEALGTAIIEVDGDVLTGTFLDDGGAALDSFRIEKGTADCASAPLTGCAAAGKAKLSLKNDADPNKAKALWKWAAAPITAGAFDPSAGSDLRLCAWDASGRVLDLGAPSGAALAYPVVGELPSWSWQSPKAGLYLYADKLLSVDGLQKIKLQTGAKGALSVGARGPGAGVPSLPLTLPITTQLVNSDTGACWQAEFTVAKKNDAGKLIAAAP